MRAEAWSLKGGATAFDAELSALVRGLELCLLDAAPGSTSSQIHRLRCSDQGMIGLALDRVWLLGAFASPRRPSGGATITIRSVPGHAGVQGNEVADQWALEAATREHKRRLGRESLESPVVTSGHTSQAFMRTVLKVRAVTRWRDEITKRCRGRRPFRIPKEGEIPRIPTGLRRAPKEVTSRFFQLASGHAMIAPFLSEKFGWIDSGSCWWCSGGRQSRENLFKECRTWKGISTLWREVGEISGGCEKKDLGSMYKGRKGFCFGMEKRQARPGNCSVGGPMGDSRFTEAVLKFLASTWVGKIKEGVVLKRD